MALSAGYKGHRCVVPNCNSGYDSCKEKVHLFSVPKEEELRKKWENAIPRANFILKSGLVVCHKHFLPEEIITKREVKDPQGNVMASETLKKPYPVKGSVPSQFPNCPAYLSKPMRKRKKPKDRSALDGNFKKKRKNNKEDHVSDLINENCDNAVEINYLNSQPSEKTSENTDIIHDTGLPENVETFQNDTNHSAEDLNSPLNDDSSEFNLTLIERQRVFDEIFNNKNSIDITGGWNRRQVEENFKCIEITKCISRKVQNTIKFVSSKKIILLPDLEIQIEISGIPVSIDKVGLENNISSVKDIENVMITLDNIKTCTGCAESNATRNVETSVAMRDCNGVLRHFKCPVVITESNKISRCKFCASTRKVLSNKYMRLKKHKQMKQLNLKLSNPAEQKKLMTMRTLYYKAQRKKKFYQDKYRDCVSELSKCQKEMSSYTDEKIEEKLLNHNISINERLVIKEILKSSKHDNKKGNRYSQEWILQCLLFHMRSPAAYRMLRDAKLLPLPCTSTIRKYLSLVDTPCGFDSNYLELFSEHLAKLPELLRHGILLLDEISTRKNVRLNTKTMEFSGLTDFGDNNSTTTVNEQADHGLVLMYHPLMESFAQPIAVCTSKGPVSGENLSKLIIQAIVVLEKAGAQIHGVVTDSATTNRKFWTMVGVSGELDGVQSWFPHPTVESRKVFVFADTPHLFKNIRNCLYNRKKLQVSSKDKPILWKHIELLYECDSKNMNARLCPKLTQQHIKPDFMLKMRVNLAVQVLSRSVGTALLKMKNYFPDLFDGCEATAEFCLRMNNLFDNLNEITPEKGLRPGSANYNELRKFLEWLDSWERRVLSSEILESDFLPKPTATGLRVTINSTIELSEILLDKCKFNYVLTGYINQDPLERFFGTIRLAGGTNDHPCTPTFLQLYKILTLYNVLKPPKLGNCSNLNDECMQPLITISRLKEIYHHKEKNGFLEIKQKLNIIVVNEDTDFCDFINAVEHDYAIPEIIDCLLYYTTEFVCNYIRKRVKCLNCLSSFLSTSNVETDTTFFKSDDLPRSFGRFINPQKELIHPNRTMYDLMMVLEGLFRKHGHFRNAFELITNELSSFQIKLSFKCKEHPEIVGEIISYIVQYFFQIRSREFLKSELVNVKNKKSAMKKKMAKLCDT